MKTITYRKSAVFLRFIVCFGFVLTSFILLVINGTTEPSFMRSFFYITAAIAGFLFFGYYLVVMSILLVKKNTLFSYDNENLYIKKRVIPKSSLRKHKYSMSVPIGVLKFTSPGFVFYLGENEKVAIPTFHLLSDKEITEIERTLSSFINERKNKKKVT